jgi:hypothetical protein
MNTRSRGIIRISGTKKGITMQRRHKARKGYNTQREGAKQEWLQYISVIEH